MADPSAVPQGNRAGYTTDGDIALAVPALHGQKYPSPTTPFELYAASLLAELQKVLARLRSSRRWTDDDAFDVASGWSLTGAVVRVVGEVWGYLQLSIVRTGGDITVPDDGNLAPVTLGTLVVDATNPQSLARLSSVDAGRMAVGHALANGTVYLDAMNSGTNIHTGDTLTLAGMWPLDNWYDSQS